MFGSENFILSSPLMLIGIVISVLLSLCEHVFRKKWIFIAANALFCAAAFVVFLAFEAKLSDLLLFVLVVLAARLGFLFLEGRRHA